VATRKMTLHINGVDRMFVCDPEKDSLSDVLRRLGFTGVKVGCGTGVCGACSVILDGKVIRSCTRKMKMVNERSKVTTIEGIGTPNNLHPLQLAWIVLGGVQCGFCSPGFIVSAKALLDENPNPTREEVREWFQKHRNACRCTGYKPIVDAVMAAAKVLRGEMTMEELSFKMPEDQRIYGTYYPRPAALAKVTGTCDYGADIIQKMPSDTLHLAPVLGRVHHAKIKNIDYSEAEKMPGVYKVITAKDVKGTNRICWPYGVARNHSTGMERPIICDDTIYRYGDIVALVAAETEEQARAAAAKVKLDLEELPAYLSILESVAPDAEQIHPGQPNLFLQMPVVKGEDTTSIIESAPYVASGSFYTQRQPHLVIEPDVAISYIDEEGRVTVQSKSLALGFLMFFCAEGLGVKPEQIREIENPTGASFGYAISPGTAAVMAACALATNRPCAMKLTYEEHQHFTGKRGASYTNLTLAADENGKLCAIEYETAIDKGPYTEVGDIIQKCIRFMGAPYSIPNVKGLGKAVYTNHNYQTAFRAFGNPQLNPTFEQLIDELAEQAGIDPLEFRYRNVYRPGDTTINSYPPEVYPMPGLIDKMRPRYEAAKKRCAEFNAKSDGTKLRGVGVASGCYNVTGGVNDHCENALELNPDGTVSVYNTWEDQGQGADIGTLVHAHECLRPLGLKPEQIILIQADTGICPISGPAGASRSHYMNGNAIADAANKLLNAMRKPEGTYRTYDEMVKEGIPTKYLGVFDTTGMGVDLDPNTGAGDPTPTYSYGFFLAEVEVDTTTGKVQVLSLAIEQDIGPVGSMQAVDGQSYGGMMQALGMALSEDYSDVKKHTNLVACGFPYIMDVPDDMHVGYQVTPRPTGPHGSTGCAELHSSSPHSAILNAIHNACGVKIHELPATPDKILAQLKILKEKGTLPPDKKYWLGSDLNETIAEIKANPVTLKSEIRGPAV